MDRIDRRKFTRVMALASASITCDDLTINGFVTEISLQGMFVKTDAKIDLKKQVVVAALCQDSIFRFNATVVYCTSDGIGVKIDEIDLPSFLGLRTLVASRSDDPEAIKRETFNMSDFVR